MPLNIDSLKRELAGHQDECAYVDAMAAEHPEVAGLLEDYVERRPELECLVPALVRTQVALVKCYDRQGTFFICGNGGSYADALHIVGELLKSFERVRSLTDEQRSAFAGMPDGEVLAAQLEQGLRGYAIGNSGPFASAVQNDIELRDIHYAQDLYAMGRAGDVVMGISTSGNADNAGYAIQVGKALGMTTISLTGEKGGRLAELADIAIKAPGTVTKLVQENHFPTYHAICAMIEAHYFPTPR